MLDWTRRSVGNPDGRRGPREARSAWSSGSFVGNGAESVQLYYSTSIRVSEEFLLVGDCESRVYILEYLRRFLSSDMFQVLFLYVLVDTVSYIKRRYAH